MNKDKIIIKCEDKFLSEAFQKKLNSLGIEGAITHCLMGSPIVIEKEYPQTILVGNDIDEADFILPQHWNEALSAISNLINPKEKSFEEKLRDEFDFEEETLITLRSLIHEHFIPNEEKETLMGVIEGLNQTIKNRKFGCKSENLDVLKSPNFSKLGDSDREKDFNIDDVNVKPKPVEVKKYDLVGQDTDYYYLKENDIIQEGDEYEFLPGEWVKINTLRVGDTLRREYKPARRKLKKPNEDSCNSWKECVAPEPRHCAQEGCKKLEGKEDIDEKIKGAIDSVIISNGRYTVEEATQDIKQLFQGKEYSEEDMIGFAKWYRGHLIIGTTESMLETWTIEKQRKAEQKD